MRYLKKFESKFDEKTSDKYYIVCDYFDGGELEKYSNYEIETLNDFIKDINELDIYPKLYIGMSVRGKSGEKIPESMTVTYKMFQSGYESVFLLDIKKCEGYWYYINDWRANYKCDDIIGVTECIYDILKYKFKNKKIYESHKHYFSIIDHGDYSNNKIRSVDMDVDYIRRINNIINPNYKIRKEIDIDENLKS